MRDGRRSPVGEREFVLCAERSAKVFLSGETRCLGFAFCVQRGGSLVPLLKTPSNLMPGAKYTTQPYAPFLVLDAHKVGDARPADADELIEVHEKTVQEALALALEGRMTSTGVLLLFLGLEKLRELQLIA